MNSIFSILADASKLSPDQVGQSVKDGVLPPDLAGMLPQMTDKSLNTTQPQSTGGASISDDLMGKADQALDPKSEILDKINVIKDQISKIIGAVHSGEVKPYVGMPLLEKKVGELDKLQAMIQPPPMQPPQMGQPAPQPAPQGQPQGQPQGLNALQSNLPAQMAYGGIVNLASGDYIDDADQNDEEEQLAFEQQMAGMPMGEGLGAGIMAVANKNKPAFSSMSEGIKNLGKKIMGTKEEEHEYPHGGIHDLIDAKAKKYNLPTALLDSIAKTESQYDPNATNKASHAKGLFQFVDPTWKSMGGKEGEQYDPDINSELGAKYVRGNVDYLKQHLGRDPSYSEVYGAHFFGPHGASSLLSRAKPDMPIEQGLSTYESKNNVKRIMKQNPNLKGKTVGEVFGDFENKIGSGIVSLAVGGYIPRFDAGGPTSKVGSQMMSELSGMIPDFLKGSMPTYLGEGAISPELAQAQVQGLPSTPAVVKTPQVETKKPSQTADVPKVEQEKPSEQMGPPKELMGDATQPATSTVQPKSAFDNYLDMLNNSRDEIKKSHETDKYMALLMAGLGTMGGTSRFAGANIGQGGAAGIQNYAEAQKQKAAEMANLDKLQMYGLRAKESSDLAREFKISPEERKLNYQRLVDKDKRDAESKAYEDALRYKNAQLDRLKAEGYDATNMLTWDEKKKNEFQNRLKAIEKDPYYLTKLQQSGIPLKSTDTSSGENLNTSLPKTKVIGGKTYELQPNNKYIEK